MRLGTGVLVFLAITVPWYAVMFAFRGLDDEGREFWWRFLIQDHLNRLMVGVHTTTPPAPSSISSSRRATGSSPGWPCCPARSRFFRASLFRRPHNPITCS